MKNILTKFYIQPNTYTYSLLDYLNHYWIKINIIILSIIAIPITYYFIQQHQYKKTEHLNFTLLDELKQHSIKLSAIRNHYNKVNKKDANLAKATEQIKSILARHDVKEETIQWQFLEKNYVYITANNTASNILDIISDLSQLDILKYKEISLTKLNRERLVQLNAALVLND